jgi:hypothetical protein
MALNLGWKFVAEESKDKPKLPRLLVCEGSADHHFFDRLIEVRKLPNFYIVDVGGKSRFGSAIRAFRLERPKTFRLLKDIVIAADNDDRPKERFDSVCAQIIEVLGPDAAPKQPLSKSTSRPTVSVLMVPWVEVHGHLEKLCVNAAREANEMAGAHVDTFLSLLAAENWNSESRRGKAWLQANLAARCERDPCVPLWRIFKDPRFYDLISLEHASFNCIVKFLSSFS